MELSEAAGCLAARPEAPTGHVGLSRKGKGLPGCMVGEAAPEAFRRVQVMIN